MKKVLIVIGDVGGGHISCARAIESSYKKYDGYEVKIVNLLQLSRQNSFAESVPKLISRYRSLELIYNIAYFLNNNCKIASALVNNNFLKQNFDKSFEIIKEESPDILILNYSPLSAVIRKANQLIDKKFRYIITVPDLGTIAKNLADTSADLIFSPTEIATEKLAKWGVERDKILGNYYPLRKIERVTEETYLREKVEICNEMQLNPRKTLVLVTGGGMGTVNIIRGMKNLLEKEEYQFIIIAGKDVRLMKILEAKYGKYNNIRVKGWTDKMLKYMSGADVVIAKPGPAVVFELHKLGRKAIFTAPIGLQEYGNVDFLLTNPNFRFVGHKYRKIEKNIEELMSVKFIEYKDELKCAEDIVAQINSRF